MSVSVCTLAYLKNHVAELRQIFMHLASGRGSVFFSGSVVIGSVFPVLWMTSCFHIGPNGHCGTSDARGCGLQLDIFKIFFVQRNIIAAKTSALILVALFARLYRLLTTHRWFCTGAKSVIYVCLVVSIACF